MSEKLSYSEKLVMLKEILDFGDMLLVGEDLFKIVSLTSYMTVSMKPKYPNITPRDILIKAYGKVEEDSVFDKLYDMISLMCELTNNKNAKYNLYGCKSGNEILDGIKDVLHNWLPF